MKKRSFYLKKEDVEELAKLISIVNTNEQFSTNFSKFVKKAESFRKLGERKNKELIKRFENASDSLFKMYVNQVTQNSNDISKIDLDEIYSNFPQWVLPKMENESNEEFTERYNNWYNQSIISLFEQVQYLIKPSICSFEKLEFISHDLTFDFESGFDYYKLFEDLCPEELINETFAVIFLVIKSINVTDDLNVKFANNLNEVQTFNEFLWLLNMNSDEYNKLGIFQTNLKPKISPSFTRRIPKDNPIEDSELKRRCLYANFYHLIFNLKSVKSSSSLDTFEDYLAKMKVSNASKFDDISNILKKNNRANYMFDCEPALSKAKNFTEAAIGLDFAMLWNYLIKDETYRIQSRGVNLKNFERDAEVRRLNITSTTTVISKSNDIILKFDTMNEDSRSIMNKNNSNLVQQIFNDENIIQNSFDSKFTKNDIEFRADLEIDDIQHKIDITQVEIKKAPYIATMVKLTMCAISLMLKGNDIDYTLLDSKAFYEKLIQILFRSEFVSLIKTGTENKMKRMIKYSLNILDQSIKQLLLAKTSNIAILTNATDVLAINIIKSEPSSNSAESFFSFIDEVQIHYISSHQSINKNKECLLEGLFYISCQNFIKDNNNIDKLNKGMEERNRKRLISVNLLSMVQDPVSILKKLIQRNITLALILPKLHPNNTIIAQDIEKLKENSKDICNTLFQSEEFETINSLLLDDQLVSTLVSQFTSTLNSNSTGIKFSVIDVKDLLEESTPLEIIKGSNIFKLELSNVHKLKKKDGTTTIIKTFDCTKIRVNKSIKIRFKNWSTLASSEIEGYSIISKWLFDDTGISLGIKNTLCLQLFQQLNEISSYLRILQTNRVCDFIPKVLSLGFMANKSKSLNDFEIGKISSDEILSFTESIFIETSFIQDVEDVELQSLPSKVKKSILQNGFKGLGKIHGSSIIHGDLQNHKNILITKTESSEYRVVFIDFGFSTNLFVNREDLGKFDETNESKIHPPSSAMSFKSDISDTPSYKKKKLDTILNSDIGSSYNNLSHFVKLYYDYHQSNDTSKAKELEHILIDQLESDYLGLKHNLERRLKITTLKKDAILDDTRKLAIKDLNHLKKLLKIDINK